MSLPPTRTHLYLGDTGSRPSSFPGSAASRPESASPRRENGGGGRAPRFPTGLCPWQSGGGAGGAAPGQLQPTQVTVPALCSPASPCTRRLRGWAWEWRSLRRGVLPAVRGPQAVAALHVWPGARGGSLGQGEGPEGGVRLLRKELMGRGGGDRTETGGKAQVGEQRREARWGEGTLRDQESDLGCFPPAAPSSRVANFLPRRRLSVSFPRTLGLGRSRRRDAQQVQLPAAPGDGPGLREFPARSGTGHGDRSRAAADHL